MDLTLQYHRCRWHLNKVARRFERRYDLDFEELISRGHLIFAEAAESFEEESGDGDFLHWFRFLLWRRLMEDIRSQSRCGRRIRHYQPHDLGETLEQLEAPEFRRFELPDAVSDDALVIVQMLTQEHLDFELELIGSPSRSRSAYLSAVKRVLLDEGWTHERIDEAIWELEFHYQEVERL